MDRDRRRLVQLGGGALALSGAVAVAATAQQSELLTLADRFWDLHRGSSGSDGSPEAEARAEAMVEEYIGGGRADRTVAGDHA